MKKTRKKIGIYCDLSSSSGLGHFRRMKFLATEMEKLGKECFFFFNKKHKIFIKNFIRNLNVIFFSNKNIKGSNNIKISALKAKISIMIFDSYKANFFLEKQFVKEGIFVVSIDDHLRKHASNIVASNRSNIFNKNTENQTWLTGSKYILIDKIKKKTKRKNKKKSQLKVLLHAGGSSVYSLIKPFSESVFKAVFNYNLDIGVLCSTLESKQYIKKISKKFNIKNQLTFLKYSNNFTDIISKYDIIAGPAGTTTFETISAGNLPFSIPLKNDGRDSMISWNNLGHLMHLSNKEKKNKKTLDSSWKLIVEKYTKLLELLKINSKQVDGYGPKRLAKKIILIEKKNFKKNYISKKIKPNTQLISNLCQLSNARKFLEARNQKQARKLSSKPNHIITWPEHVRWWLNKNIMKYSVTKNNINVAYHWSKIIFDNKGKFIVSGWFLDGDPIDKLRIANEVLNFQYQSVNKSYNNLTWIITMKKKNKFVERLNKKFGFQKASKLSTNRALKVFSSSLSDFIIMEMKI